ncbi:cupin domain-containing protein [Virgibacillus necropolis]|uniref:cupin domain-containing protein n=1 Tax=Virgibacillus necropolis TaxID=163877 RepID=UPI00384EBEEB
MYRYPYPYYPYPYPYYANPPMRDCYKIPDYRGMSNESGYANQYWPHTNTQSYAGTVMKDYGKEPFVVNINQAAKQNNTFRTAIWTGNYMQVTLMSINVGGDIGLEVHPTVDQFLRIEEGEGIVQMGETKDHLYFQERVYDDYAVMVPAGVWHNIINTGHKPIKLYTIYAPPEHPFGTVHETESDAISAEENHKY